MPTGRQGQPQGAGDGGSAGGFQAARDKAQQVGQGLREGAEHLGQRVQEGLGSAREKVGHGYRQAEGVVARNPGQSVLLGFGVGFGLGVLLTVLLTQEDERSWSERHIPDSLRHWPDALRNVPESVARYLPDALRR